MSRTHRKHRRRAETSTPARRRAPLTSGVLIPARQIAATDADIDDLLNTRGPGLSTLWAALNSKGGK